MASNPMTVVLVTDYENRPLEGARVFAGDAQGFTDARGRVEISLATISPQLRVEADGFESQTRELTPRETSQLQPFLLGKSGMPFYYRGKVRVPFEPQRGVIGILWRESNLELQPNARAVREQIVSEVTGRLQAKVIRDGNSFVESGISIVQFESGETESLTGSFKDVQTDPRIQAVGAVVRLSERHASFLTNTVIAKFKDAVDEAEVGNIAARYNLTIDGRVAPLGNVYKLVYPGPATYELLNAANALAQEPQVVFAEPDLASTVENDAVTPTDFIFPEQWDHQLIDTPDAWQALRDMDPARMFGSADVVVAVVDSGIDATHPDLSGNVSSGASKQLAVFDFVNMVGNMNSVGEAHGTSCASAAAANTNNATGIPGISEGIAGVAGNCRLIGIRRSGPESRFAEMYLWAAGFNPGSTTTNFPAQLARGADVITNSFGSSIGTPISGLMSNTFDTLTNQGRNGRGVLLFFSAGNDNVDLDTTFRRPWSMYDRCFGVAASTLNNTGMVEVKAGYSNFGSTVDWCAPSNDNEGIHNPPQAFGAHTATIQGQVQDRVIPGSPAVQSSLTVAAAAGAMTLTLNSVAGFAVNQAVLVGAPGSGITSGRLVTAVNGATNQISLSVGLGDAAPIGTQVVAGPIAYTTGFGGTSYATPVSAGTGALMLSANPDLRWDEVRDLIRATAVKIDPNNTDAVGRWRDIGNRISTDPGYQGPDFSEWYGFGRLNTAAAVIASGWRISLATPALNFNNVPEGETTLRAVRFDVQSRWPVNFQISAGPGAPFSTPLGTTTFSAGTPSAETVREVILWVGYTGTTVGATANGSVTVRNTETGRQWVIPITANTVQRQTASVMLCLDRSGSMLANSGIGTSKRIDVLKFSAEIMIDVTHEGDSVGIVSFDQDPYDVQIPSIGPLGPVTAFDALRDQLRSAISTFTPNPSGQTSIGDGVERAQDRLSTVTGYDTKSVIVFTDGMENRPKFISDVSASITDRVFAVALGRAENIRPSALTALTNGTGGYCMLTGDLDINSRYKLAKYFLQVLAGVKNQDVVRDPDGQLAFGQVHEIDFHLTEADITSDIILMTPARGMIDMTLVTPSGSIINQAAANALPGSSYFDGRNVSYYRLTLPVPIDSGAREGKWLARLKLRRDIKVGGQQSVLVQDLTSLALQQGLPYSLLVHSYSNLHMTASLSQTGYEPGAKLHLRTALQEYGTPVEGRARVMALVKEPDGLQRTVALAEVLPGVFEADIGTGLPGCYEVRFTARGATLRGRAFMRECVRTGVIWFGGNQPPPTEENQPDKADKDNKNDVLCRFVHCLMSDRVISPELRKRWLTAGFNLEALLKCLGSECKQQGIAQERTSALEQRLLGAIQDVLSEEPQP